MSDTTQMGAIFSECGFYRYALTRTWDETGSTFYVIGLNPSTADHRVNDPTIRRCIGFARSRGHGMLVMLNLFAFRSTDPRILPALIDPIGPTNDSAFGIYLRSPKTKDEVVCAWGARGSLLDRDRKVRAMLKSWGITPLHFGLTKHGAPRHPLYLRADTPLQTWAA